MSGFRKEQGNSACELMVELWDALGRATYYPVAIDAEVGHSLAGSSLQ